MKRVQYVCDRCGSEIQREAVKIIPNIVELDTEDIIRPVSEEADLMHFCDACAKDIMYYMTSPVGQLITEEPVKAGVRESLEPEDAPEVPKADKPWKEPPEVIIKPPDDEPEPKTKKRRQRIDAGKVMALHTAGWSNEKIADEIHATEEQVRQCIYYQKYKKQRVQKDGKE